MYDSTKKAADEALLNCLVFVGNRQTPQHGLPSILKGVFTLHELLCRIGIYPFMEWFVDGHLESIWTGDDYTQRTVVLELIDCKSRKTICAEGVIRIANRFYELDLWRFRQKRKPRAGSKAETRWSLERRRPKRIGLLAEACGSHGRESLEPPVRVGHVQELKCAFELIRMSQKDRCWKRFRHHQHKSTRG